MTPLIPLLLLHQNTPTGVIGLVASSSFLGFLLGTLNAHRIVARVGHIRAFAVFAALAADATLLLALTASPWVWGALRALIGFAMSGLFLALAFAVVLACRAGGHRWRCSSRSAAFMPE